MPTPPLDELVAQVQAELQPLVAKPKLTEKLLQKPPFRFLLDIVVAVTAATGLGAGLFSAEESDGALVVEKEAKLAFLERLVNFLGLFLNTHCGAKPKSIVAGLEPEATNEMLQLLAVAAAHAVVEAVRVDVEAVGLHRGERGHGCDRLFGPRAILV